MMNTSYNVIAHYADDMRNWPEQFKDYPLSKLEDMVFNYLNSGMEEADREFLAKEIAEDIFCSCAHVRADTQEEDEG